MITYNIKIPYGDLFYNNYLVFIRIAFKICGNIIQILLFHFFFSWPPYLNALKASLRAFMLFCYLIFNFQLKPSLYLCLCDLDQIKTALRLRQSCCRVTTLANLILLIDKCRISISFSQSSGLYSHTFR